MKIIVASLNPQKIAAVKETLPDYPMFEGAEIISASVSSGVSDQPRGLEEIVKGAVQRAKAAFSNDARYSFGIESGVFDVPYTKSGIMDICICAIYDGEEIHLGASSAFEIPNSVAKLMRENKIDMSQATQFAGLTKSQNVGSQEGLVGILTNGRLKRLEYTKQAVLTALIHLENAHIFKK